MLMERKSNVTTIVLAMENGLLPIILRLIGINTHTASSPNRNTDQPFGWLSDKDGDYLLPATVGDETDFICRFRVLKFADGTPFGIREE